MNNAGGGWTGVQVGKGQEAVVANLIYSFCKELHIKDCVRCWAYKGAQDLTFATMEWTEYETSSIMRYVCSAMNLSTEAGSWPTW